jgi:hypothetical protein
MKRRATTRFLLLSALGATVACPAGAVEHSCATLSVEADSRLRARHPELAGRVREAFEGRADVEPCPRISLSFERSLIGVEVELPDGRSAVRSLERSEDVVPTLEALLLVPEVEKAKLEPPPERPSKPRRRPPLSRAPTSAGPEPDRGVSSARAASQPSTLRVELSAALGVRAGDDHVGVGLGLSSLLQISSWFAGFQARADQYQTSNDSIGFVEVGILTGKRIDLEPFALDLLAGPAFALQGAMTRTDVMQTPQDGSTTKTERTRTLTEAGPQTRALFGTRLSFDARSIFHAFVALDGDVALSSSDDGAPGAAELPAWTVGLSVGSTVGTP